MKAIINKKVMNENLKVAKKMINNKSTFKDLKGIKITAKNDNLKLECANNDKGFHAIEINLQCEIIEDGSCLIDFKTLESSIINCDGDFIEIELIEDTLFINSSNFRSKNNIINDGDFAYTIEKNDYKNLCTIDFTELKKMIKKVNPAISSDKTKPILNCFYMEFLENYLALTSIDGYRLATDKVHCKNDSENSYILPSKILNTLTSIKSKNDAEIWANDKYIKITIDNINLYIEVLKGDFIAYKKLITKDCNTKITINDTKKLYNTLKGFKDICKQNRLNEIILNIKDDKMIIQDLNNTMYNEIPIIKDGESITICFNLMYLLDGLKNICNDSVLTFRNNVNPLIIQNVNFTYLLLPIRVQNLNEKVA